MAAIKILNPKEGGATHTTVHRAQKYVKNGRAQWVERRVSIQFVAIAPTGVLHGFRPRVSASEAWQRCYRTTASPALQPGLEWIRDRTMFQKLFTVTLNHQATLNSQAD